MKKQVRKILAGRKLVFGYWAENGVPTPDEFEAFEPKQAGVQEQVANRLGPKAKALLKAVRDAL